LLLAYGYQGITKIFERLARDYYFPGIRKQIEIIIIEYDLYNKNKTNKYVSYGLLQLVLVL
jgi:Integrase zinc binding domain